MKAAFTHSGPCHRFCWRRSYPAGAARGRRPDRRRIPNHSPGVQAMRRTSLFLAAFLTATSAMGHSFYSPLCCSDKDCKPIKNVEVKATPGGWQIVITGEVLSYSDSRIKQSPDGAFHRCASAADFSADGLTLCLYVPDQVG